jgi:predicted GIY-YIG superfamily endonuclease
VPRKENPTTRADRLPPRSARREDSDQFRFTRRDSEIIETVEAARARERQIKGWTRAKKEALIMNDKQRLNAL